MKDFEQKIKQRSCMFGRLLGIRSQAMYESGKKIKTFLDRFRSERGSRKKWSLQRNVIGLRRRGVESYLQEQLVFQCLVGCIGDQSDGLKHCDFLCTV